MNLKDKKILITGATGGIGNSLIEKFNNLGSKIIASGTNEEKLKNLKKNYPNIGVEKFKLDDHDKIEKFIDSASKQLDGLDILVNNAGYALPNAFHENSMEDEERCLRVLGTSVIALTKKYINDMIANGGGKIMIVSSVAAFAPASSLQSLYGPVKTFMNRFSESLSFYNKYGITSTAVCPGYTVTNFHTASGVQKEMDSVPFFLKKSAKRIAEEGVDAMLKGKKVSVPTKTWKIIVFLLKVIPNSVFSLISGLLAPGRYDDI